MAGPRTGRHRATHAGGSRCIPRIPRIALCRRFGGWVSINKRLPSIRSAYFAWIPIDGQSSRPFIKVASPKADGRWAEFLRTAQTAVVRGILCDPDSPQPARHTQKSRGDSLPEPPGPREAIRLLTQQSVSVEETVALKCGLLRSAGPSECRKGIPPE